MSHGHTERLESALAGRYKVEKKLGEGGMATVYLAEDIKHERKVALKILKPELAAVIGADRFLAEIKTTANLQHPHILPLFDSGESEGFLYYVMPFIDGETLGERLARERQMGVDESVRIARDVADALDYAHRNDVLHRDIKPGNILLHDGRPVVADFGIAVAISAAGGGRMTETGLSLGTPHYMSPEQASADRDLNARSDVYSLGCVLYEMLAGQPPHTGPSAQSILVRILTEAPRPVTDLRHTVPPHISATVAKSIEKLPADRFESARAFIDALEDEGFSYSPAPRAKTEATPAPSPASAQVLSRPRALLPWALLAAAVTVAAFGWLPGGGETNIAPATRLSLDLDEMDLAMMAAAISPDGSRFVIPSAEGLMLREAGQPGWRLLAGTETAFWPTFSPDGDWIAYEHRGSSLYKIAVTGSAPLALVTADDIDVNRPHWGEDGTIVFANVDELWRVSDTGGDAAPVSDEPVRGFYPTLLPDGSGVIYNAADLPTLNLYDFASGEVTELQSDAVDGIYVRTGHVIYAHPTGGLFALPFDLGRNQVTGSPVPVLAEVVLNGANAWYSVSRNGTLAFGRGTASVAAEQMILLDTVGGADTVRLSPRPLQAVRFSPDGNQLVFGTAGGRGTAERQIYTYDLILESLNQLTFDQGHRGAWSPDGAYIIYSAARTGTDAEDLFAQVADGSSEARHILSMPGDQHAEAWPNDSSVVFSVGGDLYTVSPSGTSAAADEARAYARAEFAESEITISPSGTYAAYVSNETGRPEVYVRDFPEPRGKWRISADGGFSPRWGADGASLYYVAPDEETIVRTRLQTEPSISPLDTEVIWRVPALEDWDLDRNTGRALAVISVGGTEAGSDEGMTVIVNWFEELKLLTGGGS